MLTINTNLASLVAQSSLKSSTNKLNQAIERMTTGFKINHAGDNAANYSITTNMSTRISAYEVAEENVSMGLDMITTASESLDLINDKLARLRALQEQAMNGTYGKDSLKAINAEVRALTDEIERLYTTTEYNGVNLFGEANFSVGFMQEFSRRDTSSMTTLAEVDSSVAITGGTYSISSAAELAKLAEMANNSLIQGGEFVLANNIDLSGYSNWTPIGWVFNGNNQDMSACFTGIFDGNGYSIQNFQGGSFEIDSGSTNVTNVTLMSLFGRLQSAEIKNLELSDVDMKISTSNAVAASVLALDAYDTTISNCSFSGNIDIDSNWVDSFGAGILIFATNCTIDSCYSELEINSSIGAIGGLVCEAMGNLTINNCHVAGKIANAARIAGGILANTVDVSSIYSITNCLVSSDITGSAFVGGICSIIDNHTFTIDSCYVTGNVTANSGYANGIASRAGQISNCYVGGAVSSSGTAFIFADSAKSITDSTYNASLEGLDLAQNSPNITNVTPVSSAPTQISDFYKRYVPETVTDARTQRTIQAGINSGSSSQIDVETSVSLNQTRLLRNIGLDLYTDYLGILDTMMSSVNDKQTEYGSASNRLESALDEISTCYENLVSSRSTLRDADIAEVSSEYIMQQILQQASVTLLATANQSPALALQLL